MHPSITLRLNALLRAPQHSDTPKYQNLSSMSEKVCTFAPLKITKVMVYITLKSTPLKLEDTVKPSPHFVEVSTALRVFL